MIQFTRIILTLFCFLFVYLSYGQENIITEKFTLPEAVKETSGLIFFNNRVITHNDSGNQPNLYEIDTLSGNVVRTISINNATNIDWEDIAQDNNYIYIADIGNNNGNRQDLKIYRILKSDYLASNNVNAETISFTYEDQTDFTSEPNNTNFDAEAIGITGNSIVIFTKNWIDLHTNAYVIPKTIGTYIAEKESTYNSQGLITGASFDGDRIMLSGYDTSATPFLVFVSENRPPGFDFFGGDPYRIDLVGSAFLEQGSQVEAIGYFDLGFRCFITREFSSIDVGGTTIEFPQKLYEFTSEIFSILSTNNVVLSKQVDIAPNPVKNTFRILQKTDPLEIRSIQLYNLLGKEHLSYESSEIIDLSNLKNGIYFVRIQFTSGQIVVKKIVKE